LAPKIPLPGFHAACISRQLDHSPATALPVTVCSSPLSSSKNQPQLCVHDAWHYVAFQALQHRRGLFWLQTADAISQKIARRFRPRSKDHLDVSLTRLPRIVHQLGDFALKKALRRDHSGCQRRSATARAIAWFHQRGRSCTASPPPSALLHAAQLQAGPSISGLRAVRELSDCQNAGAVLRDQIRCGPSHRPRHVNHVVVVAIGFRRSGGKWQSAAASRACQKSALIPR